jgi:hypothetical protein
MAVSVDQMRVQLMREDLAREDAEIAKTAQAAPQMVAPASKSNPFVEAMALGEVGLAMGTGVIGGPLAGFTGAVTAAVTQDMGAADYVTQQMLQALTYEPRSRRGQETMRTVMVPFQKIEEGADWVATWGGRGNPYASTAIKTALLGGLELTGLRAGMRSRVNRQLQQVQQAADNLDVNLSSSTMRSDVVEAARRIAPEERSARTAELHQALSDARQAAKQQVDDAYELARETPAWIGTRRIEDFSWQMFRELRQQGFDINDMPLLRRRFDDLDNIEWNPMGTDILLPAELGRSHIPLVEIDLIRKRINRNRGSDPSERLALSRLQRGLDEFMDNELNTDRISGSQEALARWQTARSAYRDYAQRFKADNTIRQLTEIDADPEVYYRWIVGASAMNAKPQAAAVFRGIRDILGENHPAVEGIRQSLLYDVARPLFQLEPNFRQFVSNYDRIIAENSSLIRAMDLEARNLRPLRDFAATAARIPPEVPPFHLTDFTRALAVYTVGSKMPGAKLARAQLNISLFRRTANYLFGIDHISRRRLWAEITQSTYGEPVLPRNGPVYGSLLATQALTRAGIEPIDQNVLDRGNKALQSP